MHLVYIELSDKGRFVFSAKVVSGIEYSTNLVCELGSRSAAACHGNPCRHLSCAIDTIYGSEVTASLVITQYCYLIHNLRRRNLRSLVPSKKKKNDGNERKQEKEN